MLARKLVHRCLRGMLAIRHLREVTMRRLKVQIVWRLREQGARHREAPEIHPLRGRELRRREELEIRRRRAGLPGYRQTEREDRIKVRK